MVKMRYTEAAMAGMLGIVLIQGFHEIEHITQVVQRYLLGIPKGAGVLGTWLDVEPVHIVYNSAFLLLIGLVYWQGRFWRRRREMPFAFGLMTFGLMFQGYHLVEHVFKIVQFIETGKNGTPGILGHFFNLVWLHFWFNSIVYSVMAGVFFTAGFPKALWEWVKPRRQTEALA